MPETIVVTVNADVASGLKLRESRTLAVDAYDKIRVAVSDGTTDLEVGSWGNNLRATRRAAGTHGTFTEAAQR
jgi:hypothetical protein